jgi:hypothetical protein
MKYIKSFLAGIAAVVIAAILYHVILMAMSFIRFQGSGIYYDEITIAIAFRSVSLPVAIGVFTIGFFWKLRRLPTSRRNR